jgi:hypothetical protein
VVAVITCAQCGHDSDMPDESWLSLVPMVTHAWPAVRVCSGLCAVRWLEANRRPTGLGVAL